jgi:transposase
MRGWWWHWARQTRTSRFVFVDESGANTAMTRLYGRAPPGERVMGAAPGQWRNLTLLGALRVSGVAAAASVEGSTDTAAFRTFVLESLVPVLHRGDVVAWDNLAPHVVADVEAQIQQTGAELRFLPPYSPDLSPIEPMWSKVKQFLRKAEARTMAELGHAADEGFASVTQADAHGWFRDCGYCVH